MKLQDTADPKTFGKTILEYLRGTCGFSKSDIFNALQLIQWLGYSTYTKKEGTPQSLAAYLNQVTPNSSIFQPCNHLFKLPPAIVSFDIPIGSSRYSYLPIADLLETYGISEQQLGDLAHAYNFMGNWTLPDLSLKNLHSLMQEKSSGP
jgi:hypothetical protein